MSAANETSAARGDDETAEGRGATPPHRWPAVRFLRSPGTWILNFTSEFRKASPREQLAIVYYALGVLGVLLAGSFPLSHYFMHGESEHAPSLVAVTAALARTNSPEGAQRAVNRLGQIVGALTTLRRQQPGLAGEIDAAFADLANGNTVKAESLLRKQLAQTNGDGATEQRKQAEYHRYLAAVVFVDSKQDALHELEAGAKEDPDNAKIWRDLGDVALATGTSTEAEQAYRELLRLSHGEPSLEAASLMRFGEILNIRGEAAAAAGAYQEATKLLEQQLQRDPTNADRKYDLSVSLMKTGDVLRDRQGNRDRALADYRRGLAIIADLTKEQPSNILWQSDLAECHIRIGNILRDQGDRSGALKFYTTGLAIQRKLADQSPDDVLAQRQLAITLWHLGILQKDRQDFDGALKFFGDGQSMVQRLADLDPTNANWQNDLRRVSIFIGDTLLAKGEGEKAYKIYQNALDAAKRLAARDTQNTQWQRGLALTYDRIGDILRDRSELDQALEAYQQGLTIRAALVARDPSNTLWQRSLQVGTSKFGDTYKEQGNHDAAVKYYQEALDLAQKLAAHDPTNVLWHCDVAEMLWDLSELGVTPRQNLEAIVKTLEPFDQRNELSKDQRKFLIQAKQKLAGSTPAEPMTTGISEFRH
jgi:tetratricopeptide (TPR) repeat protein